MQRLKIHDAQVRPWPNQIARRYHQIGGTGRLALFLTCRQRPLHRSKAPVGAKQNWPAAPKRFCRQTTRYGVTGLVHCHLPRKPAISLAGHAPATLSRGRTERVQDQIMRLCRDNGRAMKPQNVSDRCCPARLALPPEVRLPPRWEALRLAEGQDSRP